MYSVTWPLNSSKAGGNLVLFCSCFVYQIVPMLNGLYLNEKGQRGGHFISKVNNLTEGKPYALVNDKTVTYFSFYHLFVLNSKES